MKKPYPIDRYGAIFDAHVHTYFDYHDGLINPKQLIKYTKKNRFNFVNAMAHDTTIGSKKITRMAKESGLPCITGIEISTIYNHILAFGVNQWHYRRDCLEPDIVIEKLRMQDCAIFLSHPGSSPHEKGNYWKPEIVKRLDIDGIEWTNATNYLLNRTTHRWFHDFPKGRRIAGTDAHHPFVIGYAFTQVDINSEDPDDLVSAMQKGYCKPYSSLVPFGRQLYSTFLQKTKSNLIKRRLVEDHWIVPDGDRPGALVPENIVEGKDWVQKIMKRPILHKNW